jgi:hypothetical protein
MQNIDNNFGYQEKDITLTPVCDKDHSRAGGLRVQGRRVQEPEIRVAALHHDQGGEDPGTATTTSAW